MGKVIELILADLERDKRIQSQPSTVIADNGEEDEICVMIGFGQLF